MRATAATVLSYGCKRLGMHRRPKRLNCQRKLVKALPRWGLGLVSSGDSGSAVGPCVWVRAGGNRQPMRGGGMGNRAIPIKVSEWHLRWLNLASWRDELGAPGYGFCKWGTPSRFRSLQRMVVHKHIEQVTSKPVNCPFQSRKHTRCVARITTKLCF